MSQHRTGRHTAVVPTRQRPRRTGADRRLLRLASTAAAGLLLAAVLAALAAVVVVPRLAGATPLVVLTGSMAPQVPAGSVVVVRPVDPRTLAVGDVITFATGDDGALVTHRVVAVGHDGSGQVELTTRGDANGDADLDPVPASAVRGEVWYHLPWVGRLLDLLPGTVGGLPQRVVAVLVAGAALGVYAGTQVVAVLRERRRLAAAPEPWAGRTASRELLVATLEVVPTEVDADALDRAVEEYGATVLATTDTTVSLAITAPPAVVDEAVVRLGALAPVHVQRSGALAAPLGPGSPLLATRGTA